MFLCDHQVTATKTEHMSTAASLTGNCFMQQTIIMPILTIMSRVLVTNNAGCGLDERETDSSLLSRNSINLTYIAERTWTYSKLMSRDRYSASLLVHQSHLQKTQLPLFTELLSGNMSIKSITI
jgi:hypothetical protein